MEDGRSVRAEAYDDGEQGVQTLVEGGVGPGWKRFDSVRANASASLIIDITEDAGGQVINRDRMWHYTDGLKNWHPPVDNTLYCWPNGPWIQ
jgi:hypothetical protein